MYLFCIILYNKTLNSKLHFICFDCFKNMNAEIVKSLIFHLKSTSQFLVQTATDIVSGGTILKE